MKRFLAGPGPILVTGGSGFIGRHLVAALSEAGLDFTLLLRPSSVLEGLPNGVEIIEVDLGRPESLAGALQGRHFDQVLYLAGATFGRRSAQIDASETLDRLNHRAPVALLEALAHDAPRRFLRVGSLLEYGPSTRPINESEAEAPHSSYGRSMLAGTRATRAAGERLETEVVTLRPSLVYGPGMGERSVLGWSWAQLRAGRTPQLVQPAATRDPLFVNDLIDAVLRALRHPGPLPAVINLGCGTPVRVDTLISKLASLMGRPELSPPRGDEAGASDRVVADPSLAHTELGWQCRCTLDAGLDAFVRMPEARGAIS